MLEFPAQYRMRPDEELELQIDFNVRLSVYEAGGVWYLDPTGFIHDPRVSGAVEGTALPMGSIISAHGLKPGDIIKSINGDPVTSTQEAISYVNMDDYQ